MDLKVLLCGIMAGSVVGAVIAVILLWRGRRVEGAVRAWSGWGWGRRATLVSQGIGALSGVVIATGPWSGAFGVWFAQARAAGWEVDQAAVAGWFVGIGVVVFLQFALLGWYVWGARERQRPWRWVAISLMGWFVVDSFWSLWVGGAFNVWMVNVPTVLAQLPWLMWWAREAEVE